MDLSDILADAQDQDRGREFELADPVTGKPTGIKLRIAGPDSATQNRARLRLSDDLAEAADPDGRVPADARERLRLECLAACVLGWEIEEDGKPIPFSQANVVRLLKSAAWVQAQVDDFASNRSAFRGR
ncbi:hypothetical protein [Tropicimonas isoalkanivorans]|uniref:Tail assembly chaperone n=1 Tax=Tropicimonas isoalkanivorans TaxID=441112 RepID=A0A1I1EC01_9RHOB|nr:hypothetical protein [Tropicimonas isoalkanivorans]SFB82463.1 hypothetical protein SAMN04488094_101654 [Tropicimonas isoalkanivorans]